MSKPNLTLNIPEPCNENWQEMTPVTGGRHCDTCAKTVIDFTIYTDAELIRFFTQKQHTSICCRLHETQMNRELMPAPIQPFWRVQSQRVAAFLIAAQTLTIHVFAQHSRRAHTTSAPASGNSHQHELRGQLLGASDGQSLARLTFNLRIGVTDSIQVTTDSNGHFYVPLPVAFKNGVFSWSRQEVGDGFIIPDSSHVHNRQDLLTIYWQRIKYLDPVVAKIFIPTEIYGGAPVTNIQYTKSKKRSFFRRMTSLFHKKQSL